MKRFVASFENHLGAARFRRRLKDRVPEPFGSDYLTGDVPYLA